MKNRKVANNLCSHVITDKDRKKKAMTLESEFVGPGYEFEVLFAPFSLAQSEHM